LTKLFIYLNNREYHRSFAVEGYHPNRLETESE